MLVRYHKCWSGTTNVGLVRQMLVRYHKYWSGTTNVGPVPRNLDRYLRAAAILVFSLCDDVRTCAIKMDYVGIVRGGYVAVDVSR